MFDNLNLYYSNIIFYLQQYADRYSWLVPLGIIGLWRWLVWIVKEIVGSGYKPKSKPYKASVSLVVPVYNEDPKVFETALVSWKKSRPKEIIAVIDYTDKACINVFESFVKTFPQARLIITRVPGKRPALADGVKVAKSEIIALVDSDTIWGDDVIIKGLPPFNNSKVAGVATYQSVVNPKTFAQRIFDIQLDMRYMHEYPFLAAGGDALMCLSGRTAFYRRSVIAPLMRDLVEETFMGEPVISGDDKCLTNLVLATGWKVAYQSTSHVYTPGMKDLSSYLKQRLRWTRNSLRSDLKAMRDGWPLHHPTLFFFQVDRVLQTFVILLAPIFFLIAVIYQEWLTAAIIFCWWIISRTVKMYSHLLKKPQDIIMLPAYILYSFLSGPLRIYAVFTLNRQGWITRWHKSRLPQFGYAKIIVSYLATGVVMAGLVFGVYQYKNYTDFIPQAKKAELLASALPESNSQLALGNSVVLGAATERQKDLLVKKYTTEEGDNLGSIAEKFGVERDKLFYANSAKLPNPGSIPAGTTLSIPGSDMAFDPLINTDYGTSSAALARAIRYDKEANTIVVIGRGKRFNLTDLRDAVGKEHLEQVAPKVWLAHASIFIYHGATLVLDRNEVEWLKLESNKQGFTILRTLSGDVLVNKVKITSWDSQKKDYDKDLSDGRSFIMARDNSRMDFYSSEFAYLGYATSPELAVSPYGVSWKLSRQKLKSVLLTGEVINSAFHHNYFGAYTFGATGMTWRGNKFYENVRYGLDPHDDSNGFLVEYNKAYNNGTQGIIFSKRCMYNVVRNNFSYNNKLHGIMFHEESNFNLIENNIVEGNVSGIALWKSSNNIVVNNKIKKNRHGVRVNAGSTNNLIRGNDISGSSAYGFYLYDEANNNLIQDNTLVKNNVALYIKSDANQIYANRLIDNEIGIYFLDEATNNKAADNTIKRSKLYAIYTKIQAGLENVLGANTLDKNRRDVEGKEIN